MNNSLALENNDGINENDAVVSQQNNGDNILTSRQKPLLLRIHTRNMTYNDSERHEVDIDIDSSEEY